mmetsp:Transcript_102034/g.233697  ORF Transcript_102034/g.233697 Transcript_102034/m.233697 type:complete len:220 (-) Transcript_102034:1688-2347(-)
MEAPRGCDEDRKLGKDLALFIVSRGGFGTTAPAIGDVVVPIALSSGSFRVAAPREEEKLPRDLPSRVTLWSSTLFSQVTSSLPGCGGRLASYSGPRSAWTSCLLSSSYLATVIFPLASPANSVVDQAPGECHSNRIKSAKHRSALRPGHSSLIWNRALMESWPRRWPGTATPHFGPQLATERIDRTLRRWWSIPLQDRIDRNMVASRVLGSRIITAASS